MNSYFGKCFFAAIFVLTVEFAQAIEDGPSPGFTPSAVCSGNLRGSHAQASMAERIKAYQALTEEALSLRERAIVFLDELKARDARRETLSGSDLKRLNQGAATLLAQRQALLATTSEYECWLDDPVSTSSDAARAQASGIAMSLSAALILYDNYLTAIGFYQATPFLRHHLNREDSGFAIQAGELTRIAASFNSAVNRARVRRGLIWFEKHGHVLRDSANGDERYLAALIDQSPSYNMVRRAQPMGYALSLIHI